MAAPPRGVYGELPLESLGGDLLEKAAVPVAGLRREGVGQPAGSVVDEDIHRPQARASATSNKRLGVCGSARSASTAVASPPFARM